MARRYTMGKKRREADLDFISTADHGTSERWQHSGREMVMTDARGIHAARVVDECALDRWKEAGAISEAEHEAGLRLRHDYLQGQVVLRASRLYSAAPRMPLSQGSWASPAERRDAKSEAAYRRWREAVRVMGQTYSSIAIAVACEDGALAWAQRHTLRQALSRLCDYYRIAQGSMFG